MTGLLLPLSLVVVSAAPAPQIIPRSTEVVLIGGSADRTAMSVSTLGLGDGGVNKRTQPVKSGRGFVRTKGGVLVRAKSAGAKLDFPSGRELLVSPDSRVHLRSGEATLPFFSGVQLILADGAIVTIRRGANSRLPLASVEVTIDGRTQRLWSGTRRVVNASHTGAFVGSTLLALGDGGTLFAASNSGPLVALERVLCPKALAAKSPRRRLAILGSVLAASLLELPKHAPKRSVQYPQVAEAARRFAALGPLFERSIARPVGAMGEIWLPLQDHYRLKIESLASGVVVVGLYREGSSVPGVEWTISGRTELHFVRPAGGTRGGARYFLRGIDLRKLCKTVLPIRPTRSDRARVNRVIAALGGRTPRKLEVKRR